MKLKPIIVPVLIAIFGLIAVILPVILNLNESIERDDSPLFPLIRDGVEGISYWTFLFLFFTGFIMKKFTPLEGWKVGLLTMAFFPIVTFLEIISDSSSHNLWPIEFVFYSVYSIPAIIGAYLSHFLLKKFF